MDEKNRRLIQGDDIIYPITRQENVIGLQKTIKEKLPIVSSETPDTYIERQVWLDTSEQEEDTTVMLQSINTEPDISTQLEETVSYQIEENVDQQISNQVEEEEIISTQLEEEQPSAQIEDESGLVISTTLEN